MEEEEARPKPDTGLGRDLRPLSVVELDAYIAQLKAEISRVEGELAKRRDVRNVAEAMFKKSPG